MRLRMKRAILAILKGIVGIAAFIPKEAFRGNSHLACEAHSETPAYTKPKEQSLTTTRTESSP